jgi:L-arabinose isomerase
MNLHSNAYEAHLTWIAIDSSFLKEDQNAHGH